MPADPAAIDVLFVLPPRALLLDLAGPAESFRLANGWLEKHPEAPPELQQQIKRKVRDAFYTDDDGWKQQVVTQAFDAAHRAVKGLVRK